MLGRDNPLTGEGVLVSSFVFLVTMQNPSNLFAGEDERWRDLAQVPWANLGGSPVIVEIDRLYILAMPGETDASKQPSSIAEVRCVTWCHTVARALCCLSFMHNLSPG